MEVHERVDDLAIPVGRRLFITERIPTLAALVCFPPFDQALPTPRRLLGIPATRRSREFLPGDLGMAGREGEAAISMNHLSPRAQRPDAWLVVGATSARAADAPDLGDDPPASVEAGSRCGYRCPS